MSAATQVQHAAKALRAGRCVIFPTETVIGLGADMASPTAIDSLFKLKRRPADVPLAMMIEGVEAAKPLVSAWPERADELARRFWPGPLTLILPRSEIVPPGAVAGGDTVGLRCPSHPTARALLEEFQRPIAATSANKHTEPAATSIEEAKATFAGDPVLILEDAEHDALAVESTVLLVSLDPDRPDRVLRTGAISPEELGGNVDAPFG